MMSSDSIMIDGDVTFPVFKTVNKTIREGRSNSEEGCDGRMFIGGDGGRMQHLYKHIGQLLLKVSLLLTFIPLNVVVGLKNIVLKDSETSLTWMIENISVSLSMVTGRS